MTIKESIKKNWRSIALVLVIAGLILVNVKQYQGSQAIVRENQKINLQYQSLLEKQEIYNQQVAQYQYQLHQKDSAINLEKVKVSETKAELQISQNDVRSLSKRILNQKTDNPTAIQEYVKTCDSLAIVAPKLADQVDTLKNQNDALVTTIEQKSAIQDSIIKKKDLIIFEADQFLAKSMDSYNKATNKLVLTEKKLNRVKKNRSFWMKTSVVLAAGIAGVIAIK